MRGLGSFVLATIFAMGCAAPADSVEGRSSSIVGGDAVAVGAFPTVVAVLNSSLCTGTLVAPDVVLTAAHCLLPSYLGYASQEELTADTYVVLDSANIYSAAGRAIAAAETVPHPDFDVDQLGTHDIGVILLAETVDDRVPSPINRSADAAPVGLSATLIGFGLTNPWYQISSGRLFEVTGMVSVSCSPGLGSNGDLICFDQTDGRGSCNGDSGGPAFASVDGVPTVVGVTSFGDQYCHYFGAYTRIDAELEFLEGFLPQPTCEVDGGTCDGTPFGLGDAGVPPSSPDAGAMLDAGGDVVDAGVDASNGADGDPSPGGCDASGSYPSPVGAEAGLLVWLLFVTRRRRRVPRP